jgi:hypothetical protein
MKKKMNMPAMKAIAAAPTPIPAAAPLLSPLDDESEPVSVDEASGAEDAVEIEPEVVSASEVALDTDSVDTARPS